MLNTEKTMEKIVGLCKNRGFVYPGSEIYGGLANTWDYGPLGVEFKNNVKAAWRKKFVQESPYNVGLDAAILMNPQTWVASGHVGGFSDPLMDCKDCKTRHRADKLIEEAGFECAGWSNEKMAEFIKEQGIDCHPGQEAADQQDPQADAVFLGVGFVFAVPEEAYDPGQQQRSADNAELEYHLDQGVVGCMIVDYFIGKTLAQQKKLRIVEQGVEVAGP